MPVALCMMECPCITGLKSKGVPCPRCIATRQKKGWNDHWKGLTSQRRRADPTKQFIDIIEAALNPGYAW